MSVRLDGFLRAAALVALTLLSSELARAQSAGVEVDRIARTRQLFPQADRWFRIVGGQRFSTSGDGMLVPLYETLTHSRVRRRDGAGRTLAPRFPARFGDALRVGNSVSAAAWIELRPVSEHRADSEAHIDDGLVIYPDAFRDTDVVFKATPTHLDEYLVLWSRDAPTRWRYRVRLGPAIRSLSAIGPALEARDANDTPWLRTRSPVAVDVRGRRVEGTLALDGDELVLELDTRGLTYPVLVDPDWRSTGDMAEGRFYHRAVVLLDGRMLVTGGCSASICSGDLSLPDCRNIVRAAEALDLETRTFSRVANDLAGRFLHVSELLADGRVLIAGGCALSDCTAVHATAAIFDPVSSSFREISAPPDVGAAMVVATLPDGRLLIGGGCIGHDCTASVAALDPETESWSNLAPMRVARARATTTMLSDGRVLVAGGCSSIGCRIVLSDAEIYDPVRDAWDLTLPMTSPRAGHFAARLGDGNVLVGGGCADTHCASVPRNAEIFDVAAMAFVRAGTLAQPRFGVEAVTLPDGSVMVSQGCAAAGACDLTNEIFGPTAGDFALIEPAVTARAFHTLVVHDASRSVIANGGCQPSTCSWWNETYDISGLTRATPPPPVEHRDAGSLPARHDGGSRPDAGSIATSSDAAEGAPPYVAPGCACRAIGSADERSSRILFALLFVCLVVLALRRLRRL